VACLSATAQQGQGRCQCMLWRGWLSGISWRVPKRKARCWGNTAALLFAALTSWLFLSLVPPTQQFSSTAAPMCYRHSSTYAPPTQQHICATGNRMAEALVSWIDDLWDCTHALVGSTDALVTTHGAMGQSVHGCLCLYACKHACQLAAK